MKMPQFRKCIRLALIGCAFLLAKSATHADWSYSAWFGYTWAEPTVTPWTYHAELGWIWIPSADIETAEGFFLYDSDAGWSYTAKGYYPAQYHFERYWWVAYHSGAQGSKTFTRLATGHQFTVPVWKPFSADSPWNQPLPQEVAIDPDNETLIETLVTGTDNRGLFINMANWSIPVYEIDSDNTPRHDVVNSRPGIVGNGFLNPNSIPIPEGAVASPPYPSGDQHMCIIDKEKMIEWGMWNTRIDGDGIWSTGLGAITDLSGTGVHPGVDITPNGPDNYISHTARASGFPLIAGLIRPEEIKAGRIDHALVFAYNYCRSGTFIEPASTSQSNKGGILTQYEGIPMGGRIQLDPDWDVESSPLSDGGKVIARALQEYGAYCGDYAGIFVFYADNSPAAMAEWPSLLTNEDLNFFTRAKIRELFRVVDMGELRRGQNWIEEDQ